MTNTHGKVPQLRFQEFSSNIKRAQFGDVVASNLYGPRFNASNYNTEGNVKTIRGTDLSNDGEIKYDQVPLALIDKNTVESHKLEEGDLVMITTAECGKAAVYRKQKTNFLSSAYGVRFRLNAKGNPFYFKYYFQTWSAKRETNRFIRKATVANLPGSDVLKYRLGLPLFKEQVKIATFLSTIDKKISLLKQKHEQLVQYKKGIMQQLFSQQLRFKGADGQDFPDWEVKPLSEYIVKHEEKTSVSDQYPVLTSSRKGLYFQTDYYKGQVASEDNTGYNVVPRGYFTYRHMSDDLIFKFNVNDLCDRGIVSTLYPVFTTKSVNDQFLQMKLNEGDEFKRFAIMQKQGGSRTYMYLNKLINLKVKMPLLEEQNKIMLFISSIDKKINLAQQQIEQTQAYKQGLLQQMFV